MDARYVFDIDPRGDLMRITLGGFFTEAALQGFVDAREAAVARLGCARADHLALADVRGMKIQSQDMVAAWGRVLADPAYHARRLAFVVGSTLARQQLQRALGSRDARCFTDFDEAERWLRQGDDG